MSGEDTRHVVVMGVSGSGKTTVAHGIAKATGFEFAEADAFHSPESIAKMEAGIALTDADRWPWLTALAEWMTARSEAGVSTIITCSALKRSYRDVLRHGAPAVTFVHLDGPAEVIRARLSVREGHFMPASLLQSQIDTLEPLGDDEAGVVLDLRRSPDELIADALDWLAGSRR
ncbi:gluconokinase [Knoellia locipacati]|uniref:Gluconokinase n=1 Tax=Knoellia locipacati TaxID=882824 RepID=A0A512SY45_9MICO|nr:gluconokinase [Knoellia locipacati]GEQ12889.1 gluconokinase [Knoellia locipacati]